MEIVGESIKAYSSIKDVVNDRLYAYIEEVYQHNRLKQALEEGHKEGMVDGRAEIIKEMVNNMLIDNTPLET